MMLPRPPRSEKKRFRLRLKPKTVSFRSKSVRSTLFEVSGVAEGVLGQAMMDLLSYLF
jgi:hypothetical protein